VVFNTSEIRCDAFIVTVDQIRSISLPLLTLPLLKEYTSRFLDVIQSIELRTQIGVVTEIRKILKWLWDAAVAPILRQLGFSEAIPTVPVVRRIWWVGNGLLNVFPIHAAGHHSEGDNRNAMNQVISSYTPTHDQSTGLCSRETGADSEYDTAEGRACRGPGGPRTRTSRICTTRDKEVI
jgi:hypothetical protein